MCSHSGSPLAILKIPGKLREGILDYGVYNILFFTPFIRGCTFGYFFGYFYLHKDAKSAKYTPNLTLI